MVSALITLTSSHMLVIKSWWNKKTKEHLPFGDNGRWRRRTSEVLQHRDWNFMWDGEDWRGKNLVLVSLMSFTSRLKQGDWWRWTLSRVRRCRFTVDGEEWNLVRALLMEAEDEDLFGLTHGDASSTSRREWGKQQTSPFLYLWASPVSDLQFVFLLSFFLFVFCSWYGYRKLRVKIGDVRLRGSREVFRIDWSFLSRFVEVFISRG